ncbi:hypothetical protein E2C01_071545 [Portunus trituberculatus]|uniref:Uncharacterized protein n=1 Tax=Portunus trituberculatus TaxID=210409 RepID=A0A5B7HVM0_PORTR|nr:hypothetical protein [Portunus trituberculatus]
MPPGRTLTMLTLFSSGEGGQDEDEGGESQGPGERGPTGLGGSRAAAGAVGGSTPGAAPLAAAPAAHRTHHHHLNTITCKRKQEIN